MILPGIAVLAPLMGIAGLLFGSTRALEVQMNMNIFLVFFNYPLTLIALWFVGDHWFYYVTILMLLVNKIISSAAGGKVRFFLRYPNYSDWETEFQNKLPGVTVALEKERKEKSLENRLLSKIGEGLAVRV